MLECFSPLVTSVSVSEMFRAQQRQAAGAQAVLAPVLLQLPSVTESLC